MRDLVPTILVLCLALALLRCVPKSVQAETAHTNEQLGCLADEPMLGPGASGEERAAAWARYDACRDKVRGRWGIVVTDRDGGR